MSRASVGRWTAAVLVIVVSWGLAAASVGLSWAFQLPAAPVPGTFLSPSPPEAQARFDDIGVTVAVVYAPLAAVLLLRRPQPVAWLLAMHAIGSGLAAFGVQYGLLAARHPDLPAGGFFAYAGGWGFVPGTFLTAIVPLLLIPGPSRRLRRIVVPLTVVAAAAATLSSMTQQGEGVLRNPLAPPWPGYQSVLADVYAIAAALTLLASVIVTIALIVRVGRASPGERTALLWLLLGHAFLTASYIVTVLPASLQLATPVWAFGTIAPIVGQIFYPSAILVMGLEHRLRGIDVAVSAVLTTIIVTVLAVGGYLLTVTALDLAGPPSPVAVFTTAAVIAAALLPLRRAIQHRVDRLVYGDAGAPERLLVRLGAAVGEIATGADGVRALATALRRTLRLGSVRIGTTRVGAVPHDETADAVDGDAPGTESFPLDSTGGSVLHVSSPEPGLPIGRRTREAIADLAPVIGAVARLAAASTALDEARARAAAARHAERRALRRELHDGLGPALAGAGFSVAAATNLLQRGDGPAAAQAVSRVEELLDAQSSLLGRLARGGAAPVHDLPAALARLVDSFAGAAPVVRFEQIGEVRLDARRAGILHRIAAEAVLNAVRHAGARTITVSLGGAPSEADEVLRVRDDGRGLRGGAGSGVGLSSMREWAEEAGLDCTLQQPAEGGTLLRVRSVRRG